MTDAPLLPNLAELEAAWGPLDTHFAITAARLAKTEDPAALLAAAVASRAVGLGHVCADLESLGGGEVLDDAGVALPDRAWPTTDEWTSALHQSRICGDGFRPTPLVLDSAGRLYLYRLWEYERRLASDLRRRCAERPTPEFPTDAIRERIARLFGGELENTKLQRVAVATAALRSLCVVSGGPGTGKTTTVLRLLALLQELALSSSGATRPTALRVLLLAPTGKAAARLAEAVRRGAAQLDVSAAVRASLPQSAQTIHRALGYRPRTPTQFRHGAGDPLPADVVVVDEASMVDLALMAKLVAAVPEGARLVLLGDRDQLASVEAGSILGDVCRAGESLGPCSVAAAREIELATGVTLPSSANAPRIRDALVVLEHSWRFAAEGGIGELAAALHAGDADAALAVLRDDTYPDAVLVSPGGGLRALCDDAVTGFSHLVDSTNGADALKALERYRVLAAHRSGPWGIERANRAIEQALEDAGRLRPWRAWYANRPVMVARNDYEQALFNGDVGVVLPSARGGLRVHFAAADGAGVRSLEPARLPEVTTVFATTVHKSQGSEFDRVAVLLPEATSPLLSRELLYTAVTRARTSVVVFGTQDALRAGIARRVHRASGLRDALWGE